MNDQHYLTGVLETSGIEKTAEGAAAGGKAIDVESLVSMNMWGLTPEFVDLLDAGFVEFFEKAAPANPLKAEYLLPIYIDDCCTPTRSALRSCLPTISGLASPMLRTSKSSLTASPSSSPTVCTKKTCSAT